MPEFSSRSASQSQYIQTIAENDITICIGPAGAAKAQPLDSKILTPYGWSDMGNLKLGDKIISVDGKPTDVIGIYPQGIKDIFRVTFDDGSSTKCCGDHLWLTQSEYERGDNRPAKIRTTKELLNRLSGHDGRKNYSIPMVSPVEFFDKEIPLDPYLLGLLLGDGCLKKHSVSISSVDDEIISFMKSEMDKISFKMLFDNRNSYALTRIDRKNNDGSILLNKIRSLDLCGKKSYDKFIPDVYKYNSIQVRLGVLQGLMDTDGTTDGYASSYSTVSVKLKDDVKFIVESLGGKVSIKTSHPTYTYKGEKKKGRVCYRVQIKMPAGLPIFRLSRKRIKYIEKTKYSPVRYIVDISPVGEQYCQCIMVNHTSHLYVTDEFIVTHNTVVPCALAAEYLIENKVRKIVITRPIIESGKGLGFLPGSFGEKTAVYMIPVMEELERYLGKTNYDESLADGTIEVVPPEYMRGRNFHDSFIVCDEAQNLTYKQLVMLITRFGRKSKLVINGDPDQCDLPDYEAGALLLAHRALQGVHGVGTHTFGAADIVRSKILGPILKKLNDAHILDQEARNGRVGSN